jgi:hypothetical protein
MPRRGGRHPSHPAPHQVSVSSSSSSYAGSLHCTPVSTPPAPVQTVLSSVVHYPAASASPRTYTHSKLKHVGHFLPCLFMLSLYGGLLCLSSAEDRHFASTLLLFLVCIVTVAEKRRCLFKAFFYPTLQHYNHCDDAPRLDLGGTIEDL